MLPPTRLSCFALFYGFYSLASSTVLAPRTKQRLFPPTTFVGCCKELASLDPSVLHPPCRAKSKTEKQEGTMPLIYQHWNMVYTYLPGVSIWKVII